MSTDNIELYVAQCVQDLQQQGQIAVAVMLGHADWLMFIEQSDVAYTPFGSARHYQPALSGLLLVRVDEMHAQRVVTQAQLDEYATTHHLL